MKAMIIGYSGSGKSTLAGQLAEKYVVPVLYLDKVIFRSNWVERPKEEQSAILREFLDKNDGWVIDGNCSNNNYERRLQEADVIILMLFNRFSCLFRALKRSRQFKNRVRPSIADGCIEKMDWEFAKWILLDGRRKRQRERLAGICRDYAEKCVVIRNQRELDAFYRSNGLSFNTFA